MIQNSHLPKAIAPSFAAQRRAPAAIRGMDGAVELLSCFKIGRSGLSIMSPAGCSPEPHETHKRSSYIGLVVAFAPTILSFMAQNISTVKASLMSANLSLPLSQRAIEVDFPGLLTECLVVKAVRKSVSID